MTRLWLFQAKETRGLPFCTLYCWSRKGKIWYHHKFWHNKNIFCHFNFEFYDKVLIQQYYTFSYFQLNCTLYSSSSLNRQLRKLHKITAISYNKNSKPFFYFCQYSILGQRLNNFKLKHEHFIWLCFKCLNRQFDL